MGVVLLEAGVIRLKTGLFGRCGVINDPTTYSDDALWAKLQEMERKRDRCAEAALNSWAWLSFKERRKGGVIRCHAGPDPVLQFIEWVLRSQGLLDDIGAATRAGMRPDGTVKLEPLGYSHQTLGPPPQLHSRHLWALLRSTTEAGDLLAEAALNGWARCATRDQDEAGEHALVAGGSLFASAIESTLRRFGLLNDRGLPIGPCEIMAATKVDL